MLVIYVRNARVFFLFIAPLPKLVLMYPVWIQWRHFTLCDIFKQMSGTK